MAGTLHPVSFKLAWGYYKVGDVITPPAMLRDWLMVNGYVEPVLPEKKGPVRNKDKAAAEARGALFTR